MADTLLSISPQGSVVGVLSAASAAFSALVPGDGSFVLVPNNGADGTAGVQLVSGAGWSGTVDFEGTVDGINWFGLSPLNDQSIDSSRTITGAANLFYQLDIAGLTAFIVRCITFVSGTLAVSVATSRVLPSGDPLTAAVNGTGIGVGSRTVTTNSPAFLARNARAMTLLVVVTDASGGGSFSPSLQVQESNHTLQWFTVWKAAVPLTANGMYAYRFEAGASGGTWTETAFFGPAARTMRWQMVANNANPIIYLVAPDLLP